MLTPKVLGVILILSGLLGYLISYVMESKLVFFYSCMSILFGIAACIRILANPETLKKKYFFVFGVSKGIGEETVVRLCSVGVNVLIIREDTDVEVLDRLKKLFPDNLIPISRGDDPNNLSRVLLQVEEILQNKTLKGIVFTSDEFVQGEVELLPNDKISQLFENNVLHVVTTVKAFLPLLRESKGRVIFHGHVFGRFPLPASSAFSLTKSAIEGFADGLRHEMRRFDVKVIIVERCGHSPNLTDQAIGSSMWSEATTDAQHTYGRAYIQRTAVEHFPGTNAPIIRTLVESMAADNPKDRYMVCSAERRWCFSKIETVASQFVPATIMDIWIDIFHSLPPVLNLPPPALK